MDVEVFTERTFAGYAGAGDLQFFAHLAHAPGSETRMARFAIHARGASHTIDSGSGRVDFTRDGGVPRLLIEGDLVRADLRFQSLSAVMEEPPWPERRPEVVAMDFSRRVQWGGWNGQVQLGGVRVDLDPSSSWGTRDRSWGFRHPGAGADWDAEAPSHLWCSVRLRFPRALVAATLCQVEPYGELLRTAVLVPLEPDGRCLPSVTPEVTFHGLLDGAVIPSSIELMTPEEATIAVLPQPLSALDLRATGIGAGDPFGSTVAGRPSRSVQTVCRAELDGMEGFGSVEFVAAGSRSAR